MPGRALEQASLPSNAPQRSHFIVRTRNPFEAFVLYVAVCRQTGHLAFLRWKKGLVV